MSVPQDNQKKQFCPDPDPLDTVDRTTAPNCLNITIVFLLIADAPNVVDVHARRPKLVREQRRAPVRHFGERASVCSSAKVNTEIRGLAAPHHCPDRRFPM